jgi:hypothetical protein
MGEVIEKASNVSIKIISTVQQSTSVVTTIAELKKRKSNIEAQKVQATTNYENQISSFNNELSIIEAQILEAKNLGVQEIDENGNVI